MWNLIALCTTLTTKSRENSRYSAWQIALNIMLFSVHDYINDVEHLCHKSDSLLVAKETEGFSLSVIMLQNVR